jgi:hypothetical protein
LRQFQAVSFGGLAKSKETKDLKIVVCRTPIESREDSAASRNHQPKSYHLKLSFIEVILLLTLAWRSHSHGCSILPIISIPNH